MNTRGNPKLVLAVYPATRGLGYALFEGPRSLVDWGAKHVMGNKNTQCLKHVSKLLQLFRPEVVVLEAVSGRKPTKSPRIQKLIEQIKRLLRRKGIRFLTFSREQVRHCFARYEAITKHEIAAAIAGQLPELEARLPQKRRIWMPEAYGMMIFDAVALAFTHYCVEEAKQ